MILKSPFMRFSVKLMKFMALIIIAVGFFSARDAKLNGTVSKVLVNIIPFKDGNALLDITDVKHLIKKDYKKQIRGQVIESLNLTVLESIIEKHTYIKDAQVYIDAQNQLHIKITQKQPVLRVIDQNGQSFYLDENGSKLSLSDRVNLRLPLLTGHLPEYSKANVTKEGNIYHEILKISEFIRQDPFYNALTEQFFVDENNDICFVPKLGKQKIIIGNADHIEAKFRRLEKFYTKAMPSKGWNTYTTINLKFKNQVIATKEDQMPIKN